MNRFTPSATRIARVLPNDDLKIFFHPASMMVFLTSLLAFALKSRVGHSSDTTSYSTAHGRHRRARKRCRNSDARPTTSFRRRLRENDRRLRES